MHASSHPEHRDDEQGGAVGAAADLAAELASPVRLRVLTHLAREGACQVREMSQTLGLGDSQLSNHLARLRRRGLVEVERSGRFATYRLADRDIRELLDVLYAAVGHPGVQDATPNRRAALAYCRSCYDHLAGELGVRLYEWLLRRGALHQDDDGNVDFGEQAERAFIDLGVGLTALPAGRRHLGFACRDWTQGRYHLGGALGAALLSGLFEREWLTREPGSRVLRLTGSGERNLLALLPRE
ncbi:transcriptional regulator [Actinomadura sp. NBRC 104425]|uniref:ArsR/SmtB family transcription factor n=1 Tax=Actinomadura sp. NBRC 104425 TaxID=3032204 RepID=UPI0024A2FC4D|nr:metalloregulator ArsR/SmtB family transcription factor [Actinomadura sp. NBRC 104425]GLZ13062.1 transcriptional regulator [Actinomadura sp. NBRC 104425]